MWNVSSAKAQVVSRLRKQTGPLLHPILGLNQNLLASYVVPKPAMPAPSHALNAAFAVVPKIPRRRHRRAGDVAETRRGGGYGVGLAKLILLCSGVLCLLIAGNLCVRSLSFGGSGHPGRTRGNRPPHLDINISQEPVTLPLHYRDPNETWSAHCRSKYFYNSTWGKSKAPLVDKNNIKLLLSKEISSPSSPLHELKLIPTLMYLTRENVTNVTFNEIQKIQRPIVMKPTHGSGGTAAIDDANHFRCFKGCEYYGLQRQFHINETSFGLFQDSIWKMVRRTRFKSG